MGDTNSILACALRGKPCMRFSTEELATITTTACPWPRPEQREEEVFNVLFEIKVRGEAYKPWCGACPLREQEDPPTRHLTVVHNYIFFDADPFPSWCLGIKEGRRFPAPLGQFRVSPIPGLEE